MAQEEDEDHVETRSTLLEVVQELLHDRDTLDVQRYRLCHGTPRCMRRYGDDEAMRTCRYCFIVFDDDKRTAEEIVAAMNARQ